MRRSKSKQGSAIVLVLTALLTLTVFLVSFWQLSDRSQEGARLGATHKQLELQAISQADRVRSELLANLEANLNEDSPVNVEGIDEIMQPLNLEELGFYHDNYQVRAIGQGEALDFSSEVKTDYTTPKIFEIRYTARNSDRRHLVSLTKTVEIGFAEFNNFAYLVGHQGIVDEGGEVDEFTINIGGPNEFHGQMGLFFNPNQAVMERGLINFKPNAGPITVHDRLSTNLTEDQLSVVEPEGTPYPVEFTGGLSFNNGSSPMGDLENQFSSLVGQVPDAMYGESSSQSGDSVSRATFWKENGECHAKFEVLDTGISLEFQNQPELQNIELPGAAGGSQGHYSPEDSKQSQFALAKPSQQSSADSVPTKQPAAGAFLYSMPLWPYLISVTSSPEWEEFWSGELSGEDQHAYFPADTIIRGKDGQDAEFCGTNMNLLIEGQAIFENSIENTSENEKHLLLWSKEGHFIPKSKKAYGSGQQLDELGDQPGQTTVLLDASLITVGEEGSFKPHEDLIDPDAPNLGTLEVNGLIASSKAEYFKFMHDNGNISGFELSLNYPSSLASNPPDSIQFAIPAAGLQSTVTSLEIEHTTHQEALDFVTVE